MNRLVIIVLITITFLASKGSIFATNDSVNHLAFVVSDVSVTETAAPTNNKAPSVSAGADQTIKLPVNSVALSGVVQDDGQPTNSQITYKWTGMFSNPGLVSFECVTCVSTKATFTKTGKYILQLIASDGQLSASDLVEVQVNAEDTIVSLINKAPTVSAGIDQAIKLPTNTLNLTGVASDDKLPDDKPLTYSWTTEGSNPGPISFDCSSCVSTTVKFSIPGLYTIKLSVSDGALTSTDLVQVQVNDKDAVQNTQNEAPRVFVGFDQIITDSDTVVKGLVSDDGLPNGSSLTYKWSTDSSTSKYVKFDCSTCVSTNVRFTESGTYKLTLEVSDGSLTESDTASMYVNLYEDPYEEEEDNDQPEVYFNPYSPSHDYPIPDDDPIPTVQNPYYEPTYFKSITPIKNKSVDVKKEPTIKKREHVDGILIPDIVEEEEEYVKDNPNPIVKNIKLTSEMTQTVIKSVYGRIIDGIRNVFLEEE